MLFGLILCESPWKIVAFKRGHTLAVQFLLPRRRYREVNQQLGNRGVLARL